MKSNRIHNQLVAALQHHFAHEDQQAVKLRESKKRKHNRRAERHAVKLSTKRVSLDYLMGFEVDE